MPEAPQLNVPEPVLLIIADISGYTRYMTANAKTLAHSQTIITELVEAIIQNVQLPLQLAKLEGDAVFLYCKKNDASLPWGESKRAIGQKLLTFFSAFSAKLAELSQSNTCTCHACAHLNKLKLKVVVHSGEALFHRVVNLLELAGVDVIIVHRLLKNSVRTDQYLLLTSSAREDLDFPGALPWVSGSETYDEIGRINTFLWMPGQTAAIALDPAKTATTSRIKQSSTLFWKLWFAALTPRKPLRHVNSDASSVGRGVFAVVTVLLTPLFLPVGLMLAVVRGLMPSFKAHRHEAAHEHLPDGSCCEKTNTLDQSTPSGT